MKKIGFLSFGHLTPSPQSQTRSAADTLLQSIDLAVAAEELGADGAYFRVHHFARQLASPFPLLAAVSAKTSRIEIGTAVIDMRYENPFYMAEDAGAADLIAGGRLQLGISRGSPEQVVDGWRYFGYQPAEGQTDADMGRRHAEVFYDLLRGEGDLRSILESLRKQSRTLEPAAQSPTEFQSRGPLSCPAWLPAASALP
jgi:alkanesulfonate monooxygenase SsuD/methylene tetrahydromethanopterin reductase-like flavin-dependent oxidoreductase (luciferase family)